MFKRTAPRGLVNLFSPSPGIFHRVPSPKPGLQDYFSTPVGSNFASRIIFLPRSAPTLPPGLFFCAGRLQLFLQNYFSAPVGSNFGSRIIFLPRSAPTLPPELFFRPGRLQLCLQNYFSAPVGSNFGSKIIFPSPEIGFRVTDPPLPGQPADSSAETADATTLASGFDSRFSPAFTLPGFVYDALFPKASFSFSRALFVLPARCGIWQNSERDSPFARAFLGGCRIRRMQRAIVLLLLLLGELCLSAAGDGHRRYHGRPRFQSGYRGRAREPRRSGWAACRRSHPRRERLPHSEDEEFARVRETSIGRGRFRNRIGVHSLRVESAFSHSYTSHARADCHAFSSATGI